VVPTEDFPIHVFDEAIWMINCQEYHPMDENLTATITNNSEAKNKHLHIEAITKNNDVLNIYLQQLFGGGMGTCMLLKEYPSKINDDECFGYGFLVMCTFGVCKFTTADGTKYTPTQENGSVSIDLCDSENQTIRGKFSVEVSAENQDPILIEGEFAGFDYLYVNN